MGEEKGTDGGCAFSEKGSATEANTRQSIAIWGFAVMKAIGTAGRNGHPAL